MGKYIIYGVMILIVLFILNWFKVVHIPFLDVADFTRTKQESLHKSKAVTQGLD